MQSLQELVDAADVAALLRAVDGLCSTREWDDLVTLTERCRAAVEMGKQLWSVATHIDYRLALEAPPPYAAAVLTPGAGRFALGPLTEVAASAHDWNALRAHISDPVSAAAVAQERVLRGEDLRNRDEPAMAELPLWPAPWEPRYALPVYRDRSAQFPQPDVARRTLPAPAALRDAAPQMAHRAVRAFTDVVETWISQSSGAARAVCAKGEASAAVAHLADRAALQEISAQDAIAWLQWSGASGGAHGRRRGGAAGRFSAWWALSELSGVPWPSGPREFAGFSDELGQAAEALRWFRWAPPEPEVGWVLRLAVADPGSHLAWAVEGLDHVEDAETALSEDGQAEREPW